MDLIKIMSWNRSKDGGERHEVIEIKIEFEFKFIDSIVQHYKIILNRVFDNIFSSIQIVLIIKLIIKMQ